LKNRNRQHCCNYQNNHFPKAMPLSSCIKEAKYDE